MKNSSQRGMLLPIIIVLVAVVLLLTAGWYFFLREESTSTGQLPRDPKLDTFEQKKNPNSKGNPLVVDPGSNLNSETSGSSTDKVDVNASSTETNETDTSSSSNPESDV